MTLRVLVDGLAASDTPGGGYRYVHGLVQGLVRTQTVMPSILVRRNSAERWADTGAEILEVDAPVGGRRLLYQAYRSRVWTRTGFDVFHFPHEWVPPGVKVPTVITWQNVAHTDPDRRGTRRLRNWVYQLLQATAKRAERVIAPSKAWEEPLCDLLGADVVRYVPEGCSFDVPPRASNRPASRVLVVGGGAAYKNTQLGLSALSAARDQGFDAEVHIVGDTAGGGRESPGVVRRGWLANDQLRREMASALLTVFPSRLESFGLPALESLASGCPVLVLEGSTMHREFGDLVLSAPPNPHLMAETILAADLEGFRERLRTDVVRSALRARYSWEAVAQRTAAVYLEAAGSESSDSRSPGGS